jgi:glycerophosphoryl diester phosphodiesterase
VNAKRAPTWHGPHRIAHRGGGTLAPENTLAAIRVGIARGYRAVEFDVMLTADDVPVLMHDPDFGRTVAGHGSVATTSYADLARRDAGGWLSPRYAGEPVPRYEDVARFCRANDVWMNVEIKPSPGTAAKTGRIVGETTAALFADQSLQPGWPLLSSFSIEALAEAQRTAPHAPRGLLVDKLSADAVDIARSLGCVSVHVNQRRVDRAIVEHLHDAGFAVLAYTVNDPDRAQLLADAGVDAIFTDRIDLFPFVGPDVG